MRRIVYVTATLILLAVGSTPAEAGPIRNLLRGRSAPATTTTTTVRAIATCADGTCTTVTTAASGTALDEVNALRAARGLRPLAHDPLLTQAAGRCAAFRAEHGLFGHTSNDFAFVPAGGSASAAGCAAYPASYGWLSCCTFENWTYGGAAFVTGRDGRRYMHLFVR
jgi:hypothetical protein